MDQDQTSETAMLLGEDQPISAQGDCGTAKRIASYLIHICCLLALVLVIVWFSNRNPAGFGWSGTATFSWHPTLMVLGLVICYSQAIISYRMYPFTKATNKIIHLSLLAAMLVCSAIGLVAVFKYHNENVDPDTLLPSPIQNMYSLHSWVGLTTVIMLWMQWVSGFVAFYFPGLAIEYRKMLMPFHTLAGKMMFLVMVTATCLMGIQEKMGFTKDCTPGNATCSIANALGMVIVVISLATGFILHTPGSQKNSN